MVNVPVLSLAISVAEPRPSTAGRRRTMTLRRAIRLAAADATFALPEASISTCPGWSGTQRLVGLVGASHAKYLALGGIHLSAAEAQARGLVHEAVDGAVLLDITGPGGTEEFLRGLS